MFKEEDEDDDEDSDNEIEGIIGWAICIGRFLKMGVASK